MSNGVIKVSVTEIPEVIETLKKADKEIKKLTKIINEAKEYIKEQPFEIGCYDSKNKVFYKLDLLQILEGIEDENTK